MVTKDFLPIEDYFLIGDLRTAALVSSQGSIDWLCLPYFDSPSIFGKLLDSNAGCLAIDMQGYKIGARYVEDTAIVEFSLSRGNTQLVIKDFMVPQETKKTVSQYLVRNITAKHGQANVAFKFQPKLKYASAAPNVHSRHRRLDFSIGGGLIALHLPAESEIKQKKDYYQISTPIKAGQSKQLIVEFIPKGQKPTSPKPDLEVKTAKFWRQWVSKGQFFEFCRSYLIRSAITLKLMQFYPTGAMVAAPTTSLPEEIGGVRNWDYRYTWIRDATFTLYSLYALGYDQEAEHFFNFIEKVTEKCAENNFDVSLMYTIWGEAVPKEKKLTNLSGYKNSSPVRVGNGAAQQFQLDVYGSLIDAFYFATKRGLSDYNRQKWRTLVMKLVRKIDETWQRPDHGIWEARVGTRQYTYSRVMSWVGADRANRLKKTLNLSNEELKICEKLADSIKKWIWQHTYEQGNLAQHPKTQAVDATNLLFVLLQFLDKHEPLTRKIVDKTAKELSYQKVFIYRYLNTDGLPGGEGAFLLCSFWLISALAILEDVKAAKALFNKIEKYMNNQALWSEEINPRTKEYLGNYPQAFSHMGYIMSANYINKYAKRKGLELQ